MLILDKQKAVERMVALTTGSTAAEPEQPPVRARGRAHQRVATYERRPAATVPATRSRGERRRRRLEQAGEPAPA
jgi:hypothetical protein